MTGVVFANDRDLPAYVAMLRFDRGSAESGAERGS